MKTLILFSISLAALVSIVTEETLSLINFPFSFKMGDRIVKKFVHELVANAFLPNPLNFKKIRHKNGNIYDNRASNLEWVD